MWNTRNLLGFLVLWSFLSLDTSNRGHKPNPGWIKSRPSTNDVIPIMAGFLS